MHKIIRGNNMNIPENFIVDENAKSLYTKNPDGTIVINKRCKEIYDVLLKKLEKNDFELIAFDIKGHPPMIIHSVECIGKEKDRSDGPVADPLEIIAAKLAAWHQDPEV